ncbi:MAG: Ivy family c-type lysozyme inhibitor [Methyloceanibacter sp.]
MLGRLTTILLLLGCASALSAEQPPGPSLSDLMKYPAYVTAYKSMLTGETVPDWVGSYAETLDGPPTPSVEVPVTNETYRMGFTCQPNACGDNQLYVLFTPEATQAWGLLIEGKEHRWLGHPFPNIKSAILSLLE